MNIWSSFYEYLKLISFHKEISNFLCFPVFQQLFIDLGPVPSLIIVE